MSLRAWLLIRQFSPHGKISQVPVEQVRRAMICIFNKRGLPEQIKVDNGRPFGDPQREGLPMLALWLTGLGIKVIWNRPRTPQDNSKVERSQGTLSRWTEYGQTLSTTELQQILQREANFYNETFRDRRRDNTTRIERYPTMGSTGRAFNASDFGPQRIADFIAAGCWQRKVSKNGQVTIGGQRFSVGVRNAGQLLDVSFDAPQKVWIATNDAGAEIGRSPRKLWDEWIKKIRGVT